MKIYNVVGVMADLSISISLTSSWENVIDFTKCVMCQKTAGGLRCTDAGKLTLKRAVCIKKIPYMVQNQC